VNPIVASDITAHTGGGNVKLDLASLPVGHLSADTGGGNLEILLPDHATNMSVIARTGGGNVAVEIGEDTSGSNSVEASSGAGNVVVRVPADLAARVQATSGLGKVAIDPLYCKVDSHTYQSPDYDNATSKVELTLKTGAGNVTVATK
jgi:DUF4097 and DUF4098 domain-containing protein YvlB